MITDFNKASFKDFENIPDLDLFATAKEFDKYLTHLETKGHLNYRIETLSHCGPEMDLVLPGDDYSTRCVCLVSNDYLGFSQHKAIKSAVIEGIGLFGTGSGSSPALGGHFTYHDQLEKKIAHFYKRNDAILYSSGYAAKSSTLQCMLHEEDLAILDVAVHASVYEGCLTTNVKTFLHNNLEMLEHILKNTRDKYRTKMVVVNGVYSQDGDIALLDEIANLTHSYGAYLVVDDSYGIGVIGNTGRGAVEMYNLFNEIDFIIGTFSKALGSIGGYVVASPEIITYLKFQSKQHLFSTTATPSVMGIIKAIELVDEEPFWRFDLWDNINYLKRGLVSLGFDVGNTSSAIIPVNVGEMSKALEVGRLLLKAGVYGNPIIYPIVSKNNSRIRLNVMANHTKAQLDMVLNAFEYINDKLQITKKAIV